MIVSRIARHLLRASTALVIVAVPRVADAIAVSPAIGVSTAQRGKAKPSASRAKTKPSASRPKAKPAAQKRTATTKRPTAKAASRTVAAKKSKATARSKSRRRVRRPPPPPLVPAAPFGVAALDSSLTGFLDARIKSGVWGAMVVSLTNGDTLFKTNADTPLLPASTMKLYTTALAFDQLGISHQFKTRAFADGTIENGVLQGNLILRGGGDPTLTSREWEGQGAMDILAARIAAAGVRRVTGDLIGDATAFESRQIPQGWRTQGTRYSVPVSALSYNENSAWLRVIPGSAGKAAAIELKPASSTFHVRGSIQTVRRKRSASVHFEELGDGEITLRGWIGARASARWYRVVVDNPPLFATGVFRKALERNGIVIDGTTQLGVAQEDARLVAEIESAPLSQVARIMNGESNNHFAELIFRSAASVSDSAGIGSARTGNQSLSAFLTGRVGIPSDAVYAADGSGLSYDDRVTPRSMVHLLAYANTAPWGREFVASLPIAGQTATLRHRMRNTAAEGNLRAKTGTINKAITLGGYVRAQNGEELAFAFLYNGYEQNAARETIDAMGATIAGFSREVVSLVPPKHP